MKPFAGLLFIMVFLSVGCNPVRRIDMRNETGDTVRFVWMLAEEDVLHNPFLMSNSRELAFTLVPDRNKNVHLSFGDGNWSPSEVEKLAGHLESLEIHSTGRRIKIDSVPQLKEFLLARRKGIGGARIVIAVTE